MFGLRNLKSIFIQQKNRTVTYNLSPTDRQLIELVSKRRKPVTAKDILRETKLKRRTVYDRLSGLVQKGIFKNDGRGYYYVGPKIELKVTPFVAIISGIGVAFAYATNNAGVMFFSFLTFLVSYLVEK